LPRCVKNQVFRITEHKRNNHYRNKFSDKLEWANRLLLITEKLKNHNHVVVVKCRKAFGHASKLYNSFQLVGDDSDKKSRTFVFKEGGHTFGNALRCIISR
jgi:hypothetical protein